MKEVRMTKETILRDLDIIICKHCGALSHLPSIKYYWGYGRKCKLCPACKEEIDRKSVV